MKYFKEGQEAYWLGYPITSNPYGIDTKAAKQWLEGYKFMQALTGSLEGSGIR
jgi:hypothetical protein